VASEILADAPNRAQPSDAPPTDPFATLTELKRGQVVQVQEYFDHDEALAVAGAAVTFEEHPVIGRRGMFARTRRFAAIQAGVRLSHVCAAGRVR
jgi:hypothetical protein